MREKREEGRESGREGERVREDERGETEREYLLAIGIIILQVLNFAIFTHE